MHIVFVIASLHIRPLLVDGTVFIIWDTQPRQRAYRLLHHPTGLHVHHGALPGYLLHWR